MAKLRGVSRHWQNHPNPSYGMVYGGHKGGCKALDGSTTCICPELTLPTGHVGVLLIARRASPMAGVFAAMRQRRLAWIFGRYIAMVRAGLNAALPVIAAIAAAR